MRKRIIASCFVAASVLAPSLFAANDETEKDTSNRDENGKIVRGPYETNKIFDNTFVGAAWGMNMFSNKKNDVTARVTPTALDVYFGKWFCPELGLRLSYTGLTGSENSTGTVENADGKLLENFGFAYVHGDVMWNFINTIWGYRRDRVWNINPYVHCGYLRLYNVKDDANDGKFLAHETNESDNEFAAGFGLLNTFRMAERWHFTVDVRNMMFSARFHNWDHGGVSNALTATIGLQYWIGRTDWTRKSMDGQKAEALAALAAAESALAASEIENNKLTKEIEQIKSADAEVIKVVDTLDNNLGIEPIRLYFEKNSSELSVTEKMHLKYYIDNVISKDPNRSFCLTGYADASTGNDMINSRISSERVYMTIDLLVKEYGISRDRLIFRDAIISNENADPRLDRSVLIEH